MAAVDLIISETGQEKIDGGSHVVLVEKPYYHEFQERLIRFLEE